MQQGARAMSVSAESREWIRKKGTKGTNQPHESAYGTYLLRLQAYLEGTLQEKTKLASMENTRHRMKASAVGCDCTGRESRLCRAEGGGTIRGKISTGSYRY